MSTKKLDPLSAKVAYDNAPEERRLLFLNFLDQLVNDSNPPPLNAADMFSILTSVALRWPGKEDEVWASIVGLASYFFRDAVKNGEIDAEHPSNTVGTA